MEKLKSFPFHQWKLKTIFSDSVFPVSHVDKNMKSFEFFLETYPRYELNQIITFENVEIRKNIFPATTLSDIIKLFDILILIACCKFASRCDMWSSRSQ